MLYIHIYICCCCRCCYCFYCCHTIPPRTLDTVSWSPEEVCDEVKAIQQSLQTRQTLFKAKAEWDVKVASWLSVKFQSMAISTVQQSVNTFIKTIDHLKQSKKKTYSTNYLERTFLVQIFPLQTCFFKSCMMRWWSFVLISPL